MILAKWLYSKLKGLHRRIYSSLTVSMLRFCFRRNLQVQSLQIDRGCEFDFDLSDFRLAANGLMLRRNCTIRVQEGGQLTFGRRVFLNNGCSINCLHQIMIGDNCLFGEGVRIYDHNHQFSDNCSVRDQGYSKGPVHIGENCWIGSNAIILKGVSIGDNCVIGAGCVVHQDIAANSVIISESKLRKIADTRPTKG